MEPEPAAAPDGVELFDSAEAAALSGWRSTPGAHARVVAVNATDLFDGVYVEVETDVNNGFPGYLNINTSSCVRAPHGQWWENGSSG